MSLFFYGEPPDRFALRDLITSHALGSTEGIGLTSSEQTRLGVGLLPILIVRYKFTFDQVVRAQQLIAHILRAQKQLEEEVEYESHTFFGNKEAVTLIFDDFIERMTPRMGVGTMSDGGGQFLYMAQPGDIFTIAAFAHEPIPGTRFVA